MKKYRANNFSLDIEMVELTRETESTVFFIKNGREQRELKEGNSWKYHDSKDDAINYLIQHHTKQIDEAYKALTYRQKQFDKLLERYNQK